MPSLSLDFTILLTYAFMMVGALWGIAAIGVGIRAGVSLVSWLSSLIGKAFSGTKG